MQENQKHPYQGFALFWAATSVGPLMHKIQPEYPIFCTEGCVARDLRELPDKSNISGVSDVRYDLRSIFWIYR